MKVSRAQTVTLFLGLLSLSACNANRKTTQGDAHKITVATVQSKAVTLKQQYVGRMQSHRHIEIRAPEAGYLAAIPIKQGEAVKQGDLLFQVRPRAGKEKSHPDKKASLVSISAPFAGVVDRPAHPEGSIVQQGETLTTLYDDSSMWVYFHVPEAEYLREFKGASLDRLKNDLKIELVLANGSKFDQLGKLGAIGAHFNNETGTIPVRADFPNPDRLLRHGLTGTVLIERELRNALLVPLRATFEVNDKRYVYVIDKDNVAHQRNIVVQHELEDLLVVKTGVHADDKIVIEGFRAIRDGDKVEYDGRQLNKVVANVE
jgi:membrane fusion protein (multidrug efflux system)